MASDETATLARLKRYREIMDRLFTRHDGRKVNTWGDGVIAEFGSVVEAVRCAVEIQDAIGSENRDLPEERQMWFRIGINLGDVMEENGDIYGDGVNLAARLESLAEPGGIMVSESVYNFTHRQLAIAFDYAGEKQVKGEESPIAGYRVRRHGKNEPEVKVEREPDTPREADPGVAAVAEMPRPFEVALEKFLWFRDWFDGQDKSVRFSVVMIGFFFAINFFFTGIAQPWFIFPSLPFALHVLLRRRKGQGS